VNPDARSTPAVESWREGDAAMRALFDESDDAMIVIDDEGRVVAANASTCSLLGKPAQGLVGVTATRSSRRSTATRGCGPTSPRPTRFAWCSPTW